MLRPFEDRDYPRLADIRADIEPTLIDQLVLDQGLEQIGAAVNLGLGSVPLLVALDLRDGVTLDEVRRLPVGALEGGGDDVPGRSGRPQWRRKAKQGAASLTPSKPRWASA